MSVGSLGWDCIVGSAGLLSVWNLHESEGEVQGNI